MVSAGMVFRTRNPTRFFYKVAFDPTRGRFCFIFSPFEAGSNAHIRLAFSFFQVNAYIGGDNITTFNGTMLFTLVSGETSWDEASVASEDPRRFTPPKRVSMSFIARRSSSRFPVLKGEFPKGAGRAD